MPRSFFGIVHTDEPTYWRVVTHAFATVLQGPDHLSGRRCSSQTVKGISSVACMDAAIDAAWPTGARPWRLRN